MTYKLAFAQRDDVLCVTAEGMRSLEAVIDIAKDVMAALIERRVTKVLIDVRALAGRLSTLDSYDLVDKRFAQWRDRSVVTRCGIVDLKDFEYSYRFFEDTARNRGFALRIFADPDEALEWLRQEKAF